MFRIFWWRLGKLSWIISNSNPYSKATFTNSEMNFFNTFGLRLVGLDGVFQCFLARVTRYAFLEALALLLRCKRNSSWLIEIKLRLGNSPKSSPPWKPFSVLAESGPYFKMSRLRLFTFSAIFSWWAMCWINSHDLGKWTKITTQSKRATVAMAFRAFEVSRKTLSVAE